jgi:hypothetical protein
MDIRINRVTSNIQVADARASLSPEMLEQIVQAVVLRLRDEDQRRMERERDEAIDTRAADLDRGL